MWEWEREGRKRSEREGNAREGVSVKECTSERRRKGKGEKGVTERERAIKRKKDEETIIHS